MSSLRGDPESVWTLRRAIEAMRDAARQAAVPSLLWLAGFLYQSLNLGWSFGLLVAGPLMESTMPGVVDRETLDFLVPRRLNPLSIADPRWWPLILLAPLFFRLVAGLAVLSPASRWHEERLHRRAPRLRAAMVHGGGLTWSVITLWLQFLIMMFGAALIFIGPAKIFTDVVHLGSDNPLTVLIAGCVAVAIFVYGFVLSVLFQIALHSLVQNERGVGSALLHAWRIAKNDPLATARATVVDFTVFLIALTTIVVYTKVLAAVALPAPAGVALLLPAVGLEGLIGCARCAYWARAYEALGGISTLPPEPAPAT